ncbi:MAG: hypothetical protein FJY55_14310 [Betaproteobacteria bacterium]|nr:hypothetical protein [Betaproteobacteria bacterium]
MTSQAGNSEIPLRLLRDALLVLSFALAPLLASGQPDQKSSAQERSNDSAQRAPSADGLLRLQGSASELAQEWIASESLVAQELQRGLKRLERSCAQKPAPATPEPLSPALASSLRVLEQGAAAVQARAQAFQRAAHSWSESATQQVAKQCTGLSGLGLGAFKSQACRQAEAVQQGVKTLRSDMGRYFQVVEQRYSAYQALARLEERGCVRAGFTGRLMRADEAHVRSTEGNNMELIEQWTRTFTGLVGSLGAMP